MNDRPYQMCTRCVMDTSAPDIYFDENGVCNYCTEFLEHSGHIIHEDPAAKKAKLNAFICKVKASGKGKPYDCVVGVSGGVDSSWVLVKAVELGLRPLAVHMDNGWNSEMAQNNIANLVKGLGLDLYTHVIDWPEYRGLMQAFFDADVVDIELLYDNAMQAVNFQQAAKFGLKYILSGSNKSSEGLTMPRSWHAFKFDKRNIKAINDQFGNIKMVTFPAIGAFGRVYYELIKGVTWSAILDLMTYNKYEAMTVLVEKFDYKPYPYKHYESIFTRFYQGYILPRKFGIDKRRVHFSALIISGQMPRDLAVADLLNLPNPDARALQEDISFFLKKMKWSHKDLENYISRPRKEHQEYGSEERMYKIFKKIYFSILMREAK
jgi:N-acetyl sugar amidotransferase